MQNYYNYSPLNGRTYPKEIYEKEVQKLYELLSHNLKMENRKLRLNKILNKIKNL